ncbi:hypothetical protein DL770_005403 [Monosporascus sp. CRB-9-2]|nr:hypothetical protein DL770_005403 [Monosporascus sp. CRB-9-2]
MDSDIIIEEITALLGLKNPERDDDWSSGNGDWSSGNGDWSSGNGDWSSGNGIVNPFDANPNEMHGRSGAAVFDILLGDTVSLSAHHPAVTQEGPAPPLEAEDWDKFFEEYARDHAQEQSIEDSPQTSQPPAPTGATAGPQLHIPSSSGHSDTQPPFPLGEYFPAPSREPVSESLLIDSQLFAFDHEVGDQRLATPPTNVNSETRPPNPPDEDFHADWHGPVSGYPFMGSAYPGPFPVLDYGVDARAQLASGIAQSGVQPAHPEGGAQGVWAVGGVPVGDFPVGDFPVGDFPVGDFPVGDFPVGDFPVEDFLVGGFPVEDLLVGDLQLPTWLSEQMPQQQAALSQGHNHMGQLHNVPQKGNTTCYAPQGSFLQNGVAAAPQGWQFPGYPPAQGLCLQNGATVAPQEPQLPEDSSAQGHPVPLDPYSRDSIMRRVYVDSKDGETLYVLDATARPAPGQAGGVVRDLLPMEGLKLTKHHRHALPIVIERWLQSRRNQKKLAKSRRQNGGKWQVRVAGLSA